MEFDENVFDEILKQFGGNLLNSEAEVRKAYKESEEKTKKLTKDLEFFDQKIEQSKAEHAEFTQKTELEIAEIKNEINQNLENLESTKNSMEKIYNKNKVNISAFRNAETYEKVLEMSNEILEMQKSQEKQNIEEFSAKIKAKSEEFFNSTRSSTYVQIESFIRTFCVASSTALNHIFFREDSPQYSKTRAFISSVKNIQFDSNWPRKIAEIAHRVFLERMKYHISHKKAKTEAEFAVLVLGLMQNSIQTCLYIFAAIEKKDDDGQNDQQQQFPPIMPIFCDLLYQSTIDIIADESEHTVVSLRNIFLQANQFDDWASNVSLLDIKSFSQAAFEVFGAEWMKLEYEAFKYNVQEELDKEKGVLTEGRDNVPEIALNITTMIAKLFNEIPGSLSTAQQQLFIRNCIILCERHSTKKIIQLFDEKDPAQGSIIINALSIIATQVQELYDLSDATCNALFSDVETIKNKCSELCREMAEFTYNTFEQAAKDYFLSAAMKYAEGSISHDLSAGISSISQYFNTVKQTMNEIYYELEYLPVLEHSIDNQIYKMVVLRADFSKKHAITQFEVDVDTLISIFGGNDLRKIRCAKMFLVQKEEKYLDTEIPDDDVERLFTFVRND